MLSFDVAVDICSLLVSGVSQLRPPKPGNCASGSRALALLGSARLRGVTVELASLGELEAALGQEEFDVARVFVGYGASAPSAPEPLRLPKVAYSLERPATATGRFRTGEWHETWSPAAYAAAIEAVRDAIHEGD